MKQAWIALGLFASAIILDALHGTMMPEALLMREASSYALLAGPALVFAARFSARRTAGTNESGNK